MPTYSFETRHGLWTIRQTKDRRWHPALNGENLGSNHAPAAALDDLLNNATFAVHDASGSVIDTSAAGLPETLAGWAKHAGH